MAKTTVWAIRKVETGERLTYRFRSRRELLERHPLQRFICPVEVYRTTQDLPRQQRRSVSRA